MGSGHARVGATSSSFTFQPCRAERISGLLSLALSKSAGKDNASSARTNGVREINNANRNKYEQRLCMIRPHSKQNKTAWCREWLMRLGGERLTEERGWV